MGCKRLTKWWYLQARTGQDEQAGAVKGLQNGGIYKTEPEATEAATAVKGLQNGGIYKAWTPPTT